MEKLSSSPNGGKVSRLMQIRDRIESILSDCQDAAEFDVNADFSYSMNRAA